MGTGVPQQAANDRSYDRHVALVARSSSSDHAIAPNIALSMNRVRMRSCRMHLPISSLEPLEPPPLFAPPAAATPPRFDHVVVVVEENHSYGQILGTGSIGFSAPPQPAHHNPP